MQVKRIPTGALRVLMSDAELARFGASFATLQENDPQTERTVRRMLGIVCAKAGLPPQTILTVEAVPTDGGCLFLVTPQKAPKEAPVSIFSVSDAGTLLALAAGCRAFTQTANTTDICQSALYAVGDGYRLLVYGDPTPEKLAVLAEFGEPQRGDRVAAARIAEGGSAIYVGNAIERLAQLS